MVADQLRWGKVHDRRDELEAAEGYEVWMEVAEVEGWLGKKGVWVGGLQAGHGMVGQRIRSESEGLDVLTDYASEETQSVQMPYGTVWDSATSVASGGPDTEAVLAACFEQSAMMRGVLPVSKGGNLNINIFFERLMERSICLGRTAGFQRADVEEVFEQCWEIDAGIESPHSW